MISLSPLDLGLGGLLVVALAMATLGAGLHKSILWGALRTLLQLGLVGYLVAFIFAQSQLHWVLLISLVMLLAAAKEVKDRQKRSFKGWWGFGFALGAMMISSYLVALYSLLVILRPAPWFSPQYAIPLLGILLGNCMSGISLGLDKLTSLAVDQRMVIETRLSLGHSASEALSSIKAEALRTGLTPIINTMAAAGLVSLPGMMTGQILAGGDPLEAAKYQILIIFLIVAGTGFGILFALRLAGNRLFDSRMRLRLDRLQTPRA